MHTEMFVFYILQILKILPTTRHPKVESSFGPVPYGSPLSYQQKPSSAVGDIEKHPDVFVPSFPKPDLLCTYNTVLRESEQNVYLGQHVLPSTTEDVEQQTRQQSKNSVWHDLRKKRITSSVFKDVCSRKSNFDTLAARLLKEKSILTAQMKFGMEHEPVAAKDYSDITGNSLYLCGFVINPSAPHLGTSPDRKVFDPNANPQFGLLEIKCPSKDSFIQCDYLVQNRNTGEYKLKCSHRYFFQVTGQMALTGLTWCDFFVKCNNDFHLERIYFDQEKWCTMKSALDRFYFDYLLPQICTNQ